MARKPRPSANLFDQKPVKPKAAKAPRKARKPRTAEDSYSEHVCQKLVVSLLDRARFKHVEFFSVPNGGFRHKATAVKLAAEGARSGVPDLMIFVAGKAYGLEMKKARGGVVSDNQRNMMSSLGQAGVHCEVAHGVQAAIDCLVRWKAIPPPNRA